MGAWRYVLVELGNRTTKCLLAALDRNCGFSPQGVPISRGRNGKCGGAGGARKAPKYIPD